MKIKPFDIFIVFVFSALLWIGPANFLLREISHPFPTGYFASDAFQNANLAEYTKYTGFYHEYPIYYNHGREEAINPYYPSLSYLTTIFSNFSGLETYDSIVMLVYISVIIAALLFLFVFKNRELAALSAPLLLFLFFNKFRLGFMLGTWQYMISASLSIAILWVLRKDIKYKYLMISVITAAMFLSHLTDAIPLYLVIFIFLFFEKFKSLSLKHFITMIIVGIILSSIYLSYFIPHSMLQKGDTKLIEFKIAEPEFYSVNLSDFGLIKYAIIIGLIISIFFFKKHFYLFLIGLTFLFFNYAQYIGGILYSMFQARNMLFPIFICFFFGFLLFFIIKSLKLKSTLITYGASVLISVLLLTSFYQPIDNPGLMDARHWELYKWLEENTEHDSDLLYTYHESQDQTNVFFFSKRKSFRVSSQNYIDAAKDKVIRRLNQGEFLQFIMNKRVPLLKLVSMNKTYPPQDICNFDYVIVDVNSRHPQIGTYLNFYNSLLREKLLENSWIIELNVGTFSVLKNTEPGKDCLESGGFKYE